MFRRNTFARPLPSVWLFILLSAQMLLCFSDGFNDQSLTPEQLLENLRSQSFSGEKIDFVFSNTSIQEMIVYLEKISGIEFDMDPRIKKRATYHLNDVPWDQALAFLLQDNELQIAAGTDRVKIFQGAKYEVIFTEPGKAKTVIFLYRHFFKIILVLLLLIAIFLSLRIYRKINRVRKANLRDLLDPEVSAEIKTRLMYLLDVEKIFRNENLTLLSLAEKLNITPHQLSWIINDKMDQSFSTLINRYRIEEVKKRLTDGTKNDSTILQMALDSGFSTKTAFNRAFKKFTGLTPSQYRKSINS
jgi:AraC-like DNA-binding protein